MEKTRQRGWPDVLSAVIAKRDMDAATAQWAMNEILTGNASPVQIAGFAVALRSKGETVEELSGLADAMLANATPIELDHNAVDVVGSGGDRANTINISTMAAVIAAAAGAKVVKHGNRSASSLSGAADCLEALGLALDVDPNKQGAILDEYGLCFLFAPLYHGSLRHTAGPRRELGIQTTFNFLGPMSNPARPEAQAIGVANGHLAGLVAGVLARRGNRGMVFHGTDGLDELTTTSPSQVWILGQGRVQQTVLDPAELGLERAQISDFVGGDAQHNAQVVLDLLGGEQGPKRDIVLLNAAATLLAFDGPEFDRPLADQFGIQLARAERAVDSGAALDLLRRWIPANRAASLSVA